MIDLRPLGEEDRRWAVAVETESWGEPFVARRGELVDLAALPAFVAFLDGKRAGLAVYAIRGNECEVVTNTSLAEGHGRRPRAPRRRSRGGGRGGLRPPLARHDERQHSRAALLPALGPRPRRLHRHALTEARRTVKPSLPERGADEIPLAHELELELVL